ncbi:acyltransferase [Arthrobacter nitrophenolicus]|uniref:acyltransferase n=1 Tax=Arthrobacter nitrophenolicus TaxID=683150 RepID=UPI00389AAFBE
MHANQGRFTMVFSVKSILVFTYRRLRDVKHTLAATRAKSRGLQLGKGVTIRGPIQIDVFRGSEVILGDQVIMNALASHNTLEARGANIIKTLTPNAILRIGQRTGITSSTISAATSIEIGERVLIGGGVVITDSDHHVVSPFNVEERRNAGLPQSHASHRVRIDDDVFIGARSIILKGVAIGKGSVIGAGSVVTKDIPPGVIAAGNPCLPIRLLKAEGE